TKDGIQLWSRSGRSLPLLIDPTKQADWLAFTPDARVLVSGGEEGVASWDVATGVKRVLVSGPVDDSRIQMSRSGKLLAAQTSDGRLWIVDLVASTSRALETQGNFLGVMA